MNEVVADFVDSSLNWRVAMQPCGVVPWQRSKLPAFTACKAWSELSPAFGKLSLKLEASFHLLTRAA